MPNNSETQPQHTPFQQEPEARSLIDHSISDDFTIVVIGASAGGLEACRKLMGAMPDKPDMAFILVQHLDPNHDTLLVELLASHTKMTVSQAQDGKRLAPNHLYVIPPGAYLSVKNAALYLSKPDAPHGARLPIDFLLRSLADECATRSACIILSGTGSDGSEGAKVLKAKGGFIIAQNFDEAEYDGMPRSVFDAGAVDSILELKEIPAALTRYNSRKNGSVKPETTKNRNDDNGSTNNDTLHEIIELLRTRTSHDFTLYKQGTLRRRIERRMVLGAIGAHDMATYLKFLKSDAVELELLSKDILINVTSFFPDQKVFDYLKNHIIPDLVRKHSVEQPLRIWVAGCSSG